jgi:thymidylate synthase (FAD)
MEDPMTPRIQLLAYTQLNPGLGSTLTAASDVNFLLESVSAGRVANAAEGVMEYAGRVCYHSTDKMGHNPSFLPARIREGHEDVIEHASATFLIEGISRACSHQLVRHRLGSYSQESQRYVELGKGDWAPVVPPSVASDPEAAAIMAEAWEALAAAYALLRQKGIRKEDARFLLPTAAETRIVVTMNFRSWRHFIELRADPAAQWEIRSIALAVLQELNAISPAVFADQHEHYLGELGADSGKL